MSFTARLNMRWCSVISDLGNKLWVPALISINYYYYYYYYYHYYVCKPTNARDRTHYFLSCLQKQRNLPSVMTKYLEEEK